MKKIIESEQNINGNKWNYVVKLYERYLYMAVI